MPQLIEPGKSKYIILAKKLLELVRQGEGGEQQTAERMLTQFILKHKLTMEDIEGEQIKERVIYGVTKKQQPLFRQIFYNVVQFENYNCWFYTPDSMVSIKVTDAEYAEIRLKYDFYWKLYQEELEIFFKAFIARQRLFANVPEDKRLNIDELTKEQYQEWLRVNKMAHGIKADSPLRRLENEK